MPKQPQELTVGQLSVRSGLPVSTLHFYEAEGLIAAERTAANHRRYPRATLRRVAIIKVAQRLGLSLSAISEALATLPSNSTPTAADWEQMARVWRADLNERIARLQTLRDDLGTCIGCGCLSVDRCALLNPDDQLSDAGPGPRNLDPL
ncbi:redox-sensitive transcriptional activator SoxR [Roseobacter sp. HKCCA0434]|uniref:redox-sensitive transcriptional activator SoxR n=1 Tax=Roseobacter sp. HKCCA0434 TaxID=3079297 RepID=UPI002905AB1A|nr:redox-sensitive transcriptional activator SoxR [Roseobacter sp. HKCCA0434]